MVSEWPLADLCEAIVDCPHSTPVWTDAGVVVLRNENIRDGRLSLSAPSFTDETHYADRTRRATPTEGDLVITREAPMGEVCMIPPGLRCCLGQRMVLLRPNRVKADSRFLLYAIQSEAVQRGIRVNEGTGSTVSNLRIPLLEALSIPAPPLLAQRAIAHILGTLDDKIELNRRMNETLEAMARALFKSWFVDFDPVRAKVEGRDPDLPKALADLFPDSFEDSEMGEIPKGWKIQSLGGLAALNSEVWTRHTRPGVVRYVDLSGTKWGRVETVTTHANQDAPSRARRVLRPGDTIVGTVRPGNGSYAYITDSGLTGSTGFAVLRPVRPEYREFVYLAATTRENIEALAHLADGGAYPAVRPEVVARTQVVGASPAIIALFARTTAPLLESMARSQRESLGLAALRDTLLPKLISGELRVKDTDGIAQELA